MEMPKLERVYHPHPFPVWGLGMAAICQPWWHNGGVLDDSMEQVRSRVESALLQRLTLGFPQARPYYHLSTSVHTHGFISATPCHVRLSETLFVWNNLDAFRVQHTRTWRNRVSHRIGLIECSFPPLVQCLPPGHSPILNTQESPCCVNQWVLVVSLKSVVVLLLFSGT